MPRARPWTKIDDADLRQLYVDELVAVGTISQLTKRSQESIRKRVADLGLTRSDVEFATRCFERREAARSLTWASQFSGSSGFATPMADRDEQHWRRCLAEGGFPTAIIYQGRTVHQFPAREAAE